MKVERVLVLGDVHIPYHDVLALRAVENYMRDNTFDECIYLGDILDFHELSQYSQDEPEVISKKIKDTYRMGNEFLDIQTEILRGNNKKCKMVFIEGNHEYRVQRFLDREPRLRGFIEVDEQLWLKERGIEWIPSWSTAQVYKKGKANFLHGIYTNKYHANKMVSIYGEPVYYGHVHSIQSYSHVTRANDKLLEGKSLGCLCLLEQSYLRGNPTNWAQSFSVFHFLPSGYFNETTVRIFDGKFVSPDGRVYNGKSRKVQSKGVKQ